ncbi:hypothetical protein [Alloprevotella tannerae]|uniref:hypothetical protein n=1 Tax=Alloprevotella tannerae TaxID=76122 RepID=UPI0028E18D4B|nr:hypothetical protein [Alloprevotella tannerae]
MKQYLFFERVETLSFRPLLLFMVALERIRLSFAGSKLSFGGSKQWFGGGKRWFGGGKRWVLVKSFAPKAF